MSRPALSRALRLETLPILVGLALVTGCTGNDSMTGPPVDPGAASS